MCTHGEGRTMQSGSRKRSGQENNQAIEGSSLLFCLPFLLLRLVACLNGVWERRKHAGRRFSANQDAKHLPSDKVIN